MKFPYYKLRLLDTSTVDGAMYCYRPMLPVDISLHEKCVAVDALIDSGADYNMAPSELAEYFEIDLAEYPTVNVGGIEQTGRITLAIVPLTLIVGGHRLETYLGFGGQLPTILLGQKGFFNRFKKVIFEYPHDVTLKLT